MTAATDVPRVPLLDGHAIPQIGFGVFQIPREGTAEAVARAFAAGYRHVDTAAVYGNEREVGEAIRASGIPRDELFVTTKCWNDHHGRDEARRACEASLERLGLDHVDLYLVHWPVPAQDRYVATWEGFVALREEGLVRSIGVSNFQPPHLARVIEATGVVPAVNQIELHPWLQQADLRAEHARHGIVTEAWSPIGQGKVLTDPTVERIARRLEVTPARVVLRWHLQIGNVVFPKSATPSRIEENIDVLRFALDDEDMAALAALDRGERIGPDPDTFAAGAGG